MRFVYFRCVYLSVLYIIGISSLRYTVVLRIPRAMVFHSGATIANVMDTTIECDRR